ncbi:MAG: T9SS C-terminal target domain-containing protein [Bacteroidetes bacterium]|nr:T9SS C-terminal target domain-containing protein [Bacteroidota bacterium]
MGDFGLICIKFMKRISFVIVLLWLVQSASAQDFETIRNHKTPLFQVFDPSTAADEWLSVLQKEHEMPIPSGMKESLRRAVDAERSRFNQRNLNRRGNYTGNPTPPASISPNDMNGWDGTSGSGTPNDNHIAVSNSGMVISVLNTIIRVYDDQGNWKKQWGLIQFANQQKKIDAFPTMDRVFDPRVMYDPIADRFIILFMHGVTDTRSFIVVAFSQTNDPLQGWNVYKIPGKPTNDLIWSDYPIVSHNTHDVFFTVNLIGNGASWEEGFTEAIIWQLNKADGYKGDTLRKDFYSNIKYGGKSLRSICAIQNGPMPDGTDNYFISVKPIDKVNDTVFLLKINNTQQSGKAQLSMKVLVSPMKYGFPPSALQPDTSYKLRTNDCRVLSAVRIGNQIQYLQNTMNFNTMQAHLTHNTIYHIGDNPVIEAGMITDDSLDMGYPAIAAAGKNTEDPSTVITYVYSSPWHFPGTGVVYRNRLGEYSKKVKLVQGKSLIYYSFIPKAEQRWGDYEGIQAKYNEPGVYYTVGSYGKNNSMFAWISRIALSDPLLNSPVADVRIFPVPANENLFIEVKVDKPAVYKASLVNMLGQSVKSGINLSLSEGIHKLKVDAGQLSAGTYNLQLTADNVVVRSQKIIIQ